MSEVSETKLREAVREILASWAVLEISLAMYLRRLLKVDPFRARTVWASQTNFSSRLELIRKLVLTFVDDPERTLVLKEIKRCKTASKLRNKVAHLLCSPEKENPRFVTFSKSESFSEDVGMIFFDDERMELKSLEEYPAFLKKLSIFFGSRGNPENVISDEALCVRTRTKWHRENHPETYDD